MPGPKAPPVSIRFTFGAWRVTSARLFWLRCSSSAAFTAVIAIGVSCSFCERNCAVTTTSASTLSLAGAWSAAITGVATLAAAIVARAQGLRICRMEKSTVVVMRFRS